MLNQRQRIVVWAVAAVVGLWVLAFVGYLIAQHAKVTVDKIHAYAESVDLGKLSAADRAKAIDKLADMMNALTPEERRQERGERERDRTGERWFNQMTEEEKGRFIEKTMPAGVKQMIQAFEQMPEDQRKRAVDRAVRQLSEEQARGGAGPGGGGAGQPPVSDELRQKAIRIGLSQLYSQSSAQTKAELAPLLEQLQRVMESGAMMHGAPQR